MNHLKVQKGDVCLKLGIPVNYLKNKSSANYFILGFQEDYIKHGCIQSLYLLGLNSCQKISDVIIQKFSAHLQLILKHTSTDVLYSLVFVL